MLASSDVHFPAILESLARRRGAEGEALQAAGAFDLVFSADSFSRVEGFYDGAAAQALATQPLRTLGAGAFLGYKISHGTFPIWEDINYTNTRAEMQLGVIISLLRDRDIDDRRLAETDAALNIRKADFDVLLTKIGVQREALVTYWRWITVGHQLDVYENLLSIALTRERL
mgnify:CR=1 FL=1